MAVINTIALIVLIGLLPLLAILWVRNNKVYSFRVRLLNEESDFLTTRISQGKHYTGLKRYLDLPGSTKMMLEFWKPLETYEKPLEDYYKED